MPSEPDVSMVKGIATASSSSLLFPSSTVIKASLDDLSSDILPMDAAASGAHTKAATGMEAQRGINAIFLPVLDVVYYARPYFGTINLFRNFGSRQMTCNLLLFWTPLHVLSFHICKK